VSNKVPALQFHINIASLRAVILYETHSQIRHLFFGWYIYTDKNTTVRGSQNPTVYVSSHTKQGKQLVQWVEEVIEKNKEESRETPDK